MMRARSTGKASSVAEKIFRVVAAIGLVLVMAACEADRPSEPSVGPSPNVILIVVDTVRRDHLGAYGYARDTSPNIDRFASNAVRYTNAISQAPWTTPSIASLLTSLHPATLGIENERSILGRDFVFLSEVLADHGFATGAVVSHLFLSSRMNFDQGFEYFDESQILGFEGVSSPEITRRAMGFVDRHRAEPFFLWLHYFDPHWRYVVQPEFEIDPEAAYRTHITDIPEMSELMRRTWELNAADIAELERRYDADIASTDHHVGRFLDHLRVLDLFDPSMIILVSDHGEEFMDHGFVNHGHSVYGELVNVPLIVHYPDTPPAVVDDLVALVDVYPTVLELLEIERSEALVGSVLPRSSGGPAGRVVFTGAVGGARYEVGEEDSVRKVFSNQRAAISGNWKLIRDLQTDRRLLFDLVADPGEQNDLYPERGAEHADLEARLDAWIAEAAKATPTTSEIELTPKEIESLRALGYVD